MIIHWQDALVGLGLYAAVCAIVTASGCGLLRLLRIDLDNRLRFCLAPMMGLVFWVLVLGLTGSALLPVKTVATWIWVATGLLAGYGVWGRFRSWLAALPLLAFCAC